MYSERKVLSVDGKYYVDIYVQNESPEIALSHLRPMVVVLPGGGYMFTSDREAEPVALAYVAAGFNAAVVRYSVGQDAVWPTFRRRSNTSGTTQNVFSPIRTRSRCAAFPPADISRLRWACTGTTPTYAGFPA